MSDSKSKSLKNLNRTGRVKGSKNKSTLVREALRGEWDDLLLVEGKKVFMAVVEKAQEGDMSAAKLILDRVVPVTEDKMAGKIKLGEGGISIYIEKLEAKPLPKPALDGEAVEVEFEEVVHGESE